MTMSTHTIEAPADTCPNNGTVPAAHGYISEKNKAKYRNRLRRLEGQIRGIEKMIHEERYCLDILTQITAANKALGAVAIGLLDDHLRHCILDAMATGGSVSERTITEASEAISQLVRS